MFTTVAYLQSVDPGGVDTKLNGVLDPHVKVSGTDIIVPTLAELLGAAAMVSTTVATQYARLDSPNLRRVARYVVSPVQGAAAAINLPADPQAIQLHLQGPPSLAVNEALDALVNSDPAAPQTHSVIVWLADGPVSPVSAADIFTIRATNATALTSGAWTNVNITLDDVLPVGRYALVGMRAESTNMLAARVVVPGYAWRPGVLGCNTGSHREDWRFRRGFIGEWCQFDEVTLFTVDCLAGGADATQRFLFDLVKIN